MDFGDIKPKLEEIKILLELTGVIHPQGGKWEQ
jgi:hypothetical protein